MNIKELKEIIKLMKENKLTELEVEQGDTRIKLKRGNGSKSKGPDIVIPQVHHAVPQVLQQVQAPAQPHQQGEKKEVADDPNVVIIRSPMVGTFYAAPAPNAKPFVTVGQEVNVDDTICIVEAMKIMNEIKTEVAGTVVEVMAENGQAVEFDQPIMKIRKR